MEDLLDAIAALVFLVSSDKVKAIAYRIRGLPAEKAVNAISDVIATPTANSIVAQLVKAWQATSLSSNEVASMLLSAGHTFSLHQQQQKIELVWTGPKTPFVSTRQTEQALLQVINSANSKIFLTSFVAYDVSSIVGALNAAMERGVTVSMLLESSQDHGGSISMDVIGRMITLIPGAEIHAWNDKLEGFSDGRVHAKVCVADAKICFITSANLTGHAMEKNMEAGVLISGGRIPEILDEHLKYLVETSIVSKVNNF